MSKTAAKFVNYDPESLFNDSGALAVLLDPAGELEKDTDGIRIAAGSVAFDRLADAANIARLDQAENVAAVWNFGSNIPTTSANPTSDSELARKAYVDLVVQGIKALTVSARAATTTALPACTYSNGSSGVGATLTGNSNGALSAQDGVTLTSGQILLVKDQASALQNGVYTLTTVGSGGAAFVLTRHADMDQAADVPAAFIFVEEGTTNADSGWLCTTNATVTMGTTAIDWVQFSGAGQITAGAGLTKTGNTIDVAAGDSSITVNTNSIQVNVDGTTIEVSSGIRVKDGGISTAKIAADAVTFAKMQNIATNKLLGRSTASTGDIEELTIGTGLSLSGGELSATGGGGSSTQVERFTLDGTAISNKYVTLAATPSSAGRVLLSVKGAPGQHYGDDYQMDGGNPDRLTWDSLSLDGVLASGDKLTVIYDV